jgi:hypothetical protein
MVGTESIYQNAEKIDDFIGYMRDLLADPRLWKTIPLLLTLSLSSGKVMAQVLEDDLEQGRFRCTTHMQTDLGEHKTNSNGRIVSSEYDVLEIDCAPGIESDLSVVITTYDEQITDEPTEPDLAVASRAELVGLNLVEDTINPNQNCFSYAFENSSFPFSTNFNDSHWLGYPQTLLARYGYVIDELSSNERDQFDYNQLQVGDVITYHTYVLTDDYESGMYVYDPFHAAVVTDIDSNGNATVESKLGKSYIAEGDLFFHGDHYHNRSGEEENEDFIVRTHRPDPSFEFIEVSEGETEDGKIIRLALARTAKPYSH